MRSVKERFWSKVNKKGPIPEVCPELGPCWIWIAGSDTATGYGKFGVNYKVVRTHRFAWEMVHGEIDDPKVCVCHRCDNRKCVNTAHMFLGSRGDNNKDSVAKGRNARGAAHPNTRHSDADIAEMRRLHAEEMRTAEIEAKFGVSHVHLWRILTKQRRKSTPSQTS